MRICLDFDGVLHDAAHPIPHRQMGPPIEGALDAVRILRRHHTLVVCTARPRVEHVCDWLNYYGFGFARSDVTNTKPQADIYLDDKGVHFEDWLTTLPVLVGRASSLRMQQGRHRG